MIRWYDYAWAILVADLLTGLIINASTAETFWVQIGISVLFALIWDLWSNIYCQVRLRMEEKRE
jgi:hypothetical protein